MRTKTEVPRESPEVVRVWIQDASPQGCMHWVELSRQDAIRFLELGVEARRIADELSYRKAIKAVAREVGLSNLRVRRLVDWEPDN